ELASWRDTARDHELRLAIETALSLARGMTGGTKGLRPPEPCPGG
ncbi:MAG: hypothetical protein HQK81_13905, partial [Desulfovibrionaceae bacterium]|nr:hypothetical protein [Desulfovibrionaceae bacterium]